MSNPTPYVFPSFEGDESPAAGASRGGPPRKAGLHVHERRIDALLVDDDLETLEEMQEALELAGAHTLVACNAGEAVRFLRDHDIAVLVTDIRMPGASGLTLASILRAELRAHAPEVIFVSGHADRDTVAEAARLAPRQILVKPIALEHLIATVLAAMAAHAERAHARAAAAAAAPAAPRAKAQARQASPPVVAPAAAEAGSPQPHGPAWEIIQHLVGRGVEACQAGQAGQAGDGAAVLDVEWEAVEPPDPARLRRAIGVRGPGALAPVQPAGAWRRPA